MDDSLAGEGAAKPPVHLEVPAGLRLETPGVWIPSRGELAWRMVAEQAGNYDLIVHLADESFAKSVQVSEEFVNRSPLRAVPGFVDQLLFPAEKSLPRVDPVLSYRAGLPRGSDLLLHASMDVDLLRPDDRLRVRPAQADEGHDLRPGRGWSLSTRPSWD